MKEVFRDKKPEELAGRTEVVSGTVNVHRAQEILEQYFQTEKVEDRAKLVRDGENILAKMRQFYGSKNLAPLTLETWEDHQEARVEGVDFISGTISTSDGASREVILEIPDGGDPKTRLLKIDWECLEGYSEIRWDRFLAEEPEEPKQFRVFMSQDTYYNPPFSDTNRYICFKIQRPDGLGKDYGYCFGYLDIGNISLRTKLAPVLRKSIESGQGGMLKCRVHLQFIPESRKRPNLIQQVRIADFQADWLQVNPPSSE